MAQGHPSISAPLRRLSSRSVPWLLGAIGLTVLQLPVAGAEANSKGVPALYATQAAAEAAATKHFNCSGAHPMGNQWMPCANHGQPSGAAHHHHP